MKILVALAVFFLVSTQLFAEEIGANNDLNYWSDWSDSDQIKVRLSPGMVRVLLPGLGNCYFPRDRSARSLEGTTAATVEARGGEVMARLSP